MIFDQMSRLRLLPLATLGVGCYLGCKIERSRTDSAKGKGACGNSAAGEEDVTLTAANDTLFVNLSIPRIHAASSLIPSNKGLKDAPSVQLSASRVSEIMTHGFPSLDNISTYDDFVLAYDKKNRTPRWVFEHLTAERVRKAEGIDRNKSTFFEDQGQHRFFRSSNDDYKGSGYDRGHLAAAGNHMLSQKVMDQTFVLSNICPQVGKGFNRDAWNKLEKFVRHLTKKYKNVYVCTGPLYLPRREPDGKLYVKYEVIGMNHVAVPTHFFKVVVMEAESGEKELLSFVMPNQVLPDDVDLKAYLVPSETIERGSGLLLFDKIPRSAFAKINGKKT